jgi:hypothetical protein
MAGGPTFRVETPAQECSMLLKDKFSGDLLSLQYHVEFKKQKAAGSILL